MILPVGTHRIHLQRRGGNHAAISDVTDVPVIPVSQLPFEVIPHLYPSRYCPSDRLGRFAWRQFGDIASGHERVVAICNWIHDNVDYISGSSDGSTSATRPSPSGRASAATSPISGSPSRGRSGIPARFVSVYALNLVPQDFHAVFEAYLGGRWYVFDATRLCPIDRITKIAVGRDAADTAFATYFGQLSGPPKLISVRQSDGEAVQDWTVDAVSFSR